jgi:hypothetical protein
LVSVLTLSRDRDRAPARDRFRLPKEFKVLLAGKFIESVSAKYLDNTKPVKLLDAGWLKAKVFPPTSKLRPDRPESVIEYVIAHPAAQGDPFGLVEGPMNAEINPALAVLFLGLR